MATHVTSRPRFGARPLALTRTRASAAVAAITALAAVLRFANFSQVPSNSFYDAAVRSMGQSWHNFFYGAFEPAAQVSIDKTPVDLWLQVASTKLFGFGSVAVRLPEALAGVLAVPLVYDLVRRLFGRTAGLGAAAALALLPISIVTAHSDTMDSLMMLLDVLAAWLVVVGAQRRSAWPVVAAGAVLGLAFNVKVFEALIVLPALVVLAWLASDAPARQRLRTIAAGFAAFVAVSISWVTAASLAPGHHPWPIGSTNGSVWNVVFGFNGINRLRGHASAAALQADPPGPLRFLSTTGVHYANLVGATLLAAVVFGALAVAVAVAARTGRLRGRDRLPFAGAAFFGVWLVTGVGMLSMAQRMQPRYLEAVTPAIAGVLGIGVAWLAARAACRRSPAIALAGGAAVVAVAAAALVPAPAWATLAALAGACACAAVAATPRRPAAALAVCALVAALSVPFASSLSVARQHRSNAGLTLDAPVALSTFLIGHQGSARYEVASTTVFRSSPLIVRDARPVLMLTSYQGRPLLNAARLKQLVRAGEVRYILMGAGDCSSTGCAAVVRWAHAHAHDVSRAAGVAPGTLFALKP
jgi:4-amino-4-deoxy-L-arabinose transferase-like glycosyltransferase